MRFKKRAGRFVTQKRGCSCRPPRLVLRLPCLALRGAGRRSLGIRLPAAAYDDCLDPEIDAHEVGLAVLEPLLIIIMFLLIGSLLMSIMVPLMTATRNAF